MMMGFGLFLCFQHMAMGLRRAETMPRGYSLAFGGHAGIQEPAGAGVPAQLSAVAPH